jgi:hypothetical protein
MADGVGDYEHRVDVIYEFPTNRPRFMKWAIFNRERWGGIQLLELESLASQERLLVRFAPEELTQKLSEEDMSATALVEDTLTWHRPNLLGPE